MADRTAIEWTDATVNFWWGCTKVGPGCDHCYVETWDKRTGGAHWGTGAPRRRIVSAPATLARLNRQGGKRVFIQSMSDLFDNEVSVDWLHDAWHHITRADRCRIQIVTKRISAVEKRLAEIGPTRWPQHAGLMITVVNQAEADRDIPRLLALKAKLGIPWVGLSMEPLLGQVDITPYLFIYTHMDQHLLDCHPELALPYRDPATTDPADILTPALDWVIVGGESGPGARPMHPDWARSLRDQCQAAGVPFFFKQWGEWHTGYVRLTERMAVFKRFENFQQWVNKASTWVQGGTCIDAVGRHCKIGADFMRARDEGTFPVTIMHKVGRSRAGRLLDGCEWNEFPGALE